MRRMPEARQQLTECKRISEADWQGNLGEQCMSAVPYFALQQVKQRTAIMTRTIRASNHVHNFVPAKDRREAVRFKDFALAPKHRSAMPEQSDNETDTASPPASPAARRGW